MRYRIKLDCRKGTRRLVHDGHGARWEDEYHTITWCEEDTLEDAIAAVSRALENPREIRNAWYEIIRE